MKLPEALNEERHNKTSKKSRNTLPAFSGPPEVRPMQPAAGSTRRGQSLSDKATNPGRRLHAIEAAAKKSPPIRLPWIYHLRPSRAGTRRAYWDVAATFSLIVNAILVGLILVMTGQVRNLKTTVNNLLGGLYGNFVKLDQASINTSLKVDAQIPL
jgi:hypothetical protein